MSDLRLTPGSMSRNRCTFHVLSVELENGFESRCSGIIDMTPSRSENMYWYIRRYLRNSYEISTFDVK